jgi:hypothetical protein
LAGRPFLFPEAKPMMLSILLSAALLAQTPAAGQASRPTPAAAPKPQGAFEFTTDIGAFIVVVKADQAAAFDAAMTKLKQTLNGDKDTTRRALATSWRVLKSAEKPTDDTLLYVWLIEPAAKDVSYDPIELMKTSAPADVQALADQLRGAIVSLTRVGLTEVAKITR